MPKNGGRRDHRVSLVPVKHQIGCGYAIFRPSRQYGLGGFFLISGFHKFDRQYLIPAIALFDGSMASGELKTIL